MQNTLKHQSLINKVMVPADSTWIQLLIHVFILQEYKWI